jgi:Undecaprenyl-phosphate glucose phosphotransferase
MTGRLIDQEVAQRVVKYVDGTMLVSIAMIVTFLSLAANNVAAAFIAIIVSLATMLALRTAGLYQPMRWVKWPPNAALSVITAASVGLGVATVSTFLPWHLPVHWLVHWTLLSGFYFAFSRFIASLWAGTAAKTGRFTQRVAIVGGGEAAEDALELLAQSKQLAIEIVGLFDDRDDTRSPASVHKYAKIGKIADLAEFARGNRIDLVIVAIPMSAEQRLLQILKRLWELPVDIRISAASSELKLSPQAYSYLGELPMLNVFERPLRGWHAFLKDCIDRVLATIAIIVFSPVLAATALAVKLDSKGPVLFKQKRFGFNNEVIEVYKFRSMYADKSDFAATKQVTKGDPRVTKVGRIIRKSSLDELPQLFNVLAGDLSLVGPRPHATRASAAGSLYDEVVDGYFARHKVKPGITGWAQINGWRGETDTVEKIEQRVKHDLEYIDRWSLGFDLYILAKTPLSLLKTENAY